MRIVSFSGRIDRQTFFALTVLLYVLGIVFALLSASGAVSLFLDFPAEHVPDALKGTKLPPVVGWTFFVVGLLGVLWVVLGMIGVSVRRLHDFGLTGFLVLAYPVLKQVIPGTGWPDWLPGPADILWTLVLVAQPGTRGPNAFGQDPRDPAAEPKV